MTQSKTKRMRARIASLLLALLAGSAPSAVAQSIPAQSPDYLVQLGAACIQRADQSTTRAEKVDWLGKATAQFNAAAQKRPGHYQTHALWAQALFGLLREIDDAPQRETVATAAQKQFELAASLPGHDWHLSYSWGRFLTYRAVSLSSPADRAARLTEGRRLLEACLAPAQPGAERAIVSAALADCLLQQALADGDADARQALAQQATAAFDSAFQSSPRHLNSVDHRSWATALRLRGRWANDPSLTRAAISQLNEALALDSDDALTRVELVRCHVALGELDSAFRQLRALYDRHPPQDIRAVVASDPDLASLRDDARFRDLAGNNQPDAIHGQLLQAALQSRTAAENATDRGVALKHYATATDLYGDVIRQKPGDYLALLDRGHCLRMQAQLTGTAAGQATFYRLAAQDFEAASRCEGADWRVHYEWALLCLQPANRPAETAGAQQAALRDGITQLERALSLADSRADKASVLSDLSIAVFRLGMVTEIATDKQRLFGQAAEQIQSLEKLVPGRMTAQHYGLWGVALVEQAKVANDRMRLRQAVERLLTALELEPQNTEVRYHLVRAYALSEQPEQALRHVRILLENDPNHKYRALAEANSELDSLRRVPEFNQLFETDRH